MASPLGYSYASFIKEKRGKDKFLKGNVKSLMKQPQSTRRKLNIVQENKSKRKQLREKRVLQVLL
jgi:hypothetical protein